MSLTGRAAVRAAATSVAVAALLLGAGAPGPVDRPVGPDERVVGTSMPDRPTLPTTTVVEAPEPADRAVAMSRLLHVRAEVVVVAGEAAAEELAASAAVRLRAPALSSTAPGLADEIDRLGARTVLVIGGGPGVHPDERLVRAVGREVDAAVSELRPTAADDPPGADVVLLTRDPAADRLAVATAAGAEVVAVPGGDARGEPGAVRALRDGPERPAIVLGPDWADPAYTLDVLRHAPEQPGGGHLVLPGRHLVALYGHPQTAALGLLGEQDPAASVERVRALAAEYAALDAAPVVPTFEIIATIASAGPGADGDYSDETPVGVLRPWVDAARDAGVYVILDLQPGRTDFLTQARLYADLLAEPHVGLALDPEWRLRADQVHLRQIGTVTTAEINAVGDWLAALTRDRRLPQKLFVLHQFSRSMITEREQLATGRAELATVVHVDGQGAQPDKRSTWAVIRDGAPPGLFWGWKNFIDEDLPMATPAETWAVDPRPDLVTYQ
ncbi:hypothetical protein HMPREF0063_10366 [Aeromicrobium marinum DSM 15272]|uniref:Cell wall binding repeat 2 n=1 Tax=Aeromicrobium marinum DSM 15272 TaxID=585531 RepID=E2S8K9_9ACTN|nr:hypothetical protein [Aeromicrobium marinum]EFQ84514.1 hypothetical protein HMPREF0063_10366 [Aeromicrobium marinum DSM 15272]